MVQGVSHREAAREGQSPGVAVLGSVRAGREGLREGGHRLAERGAIPGPGTSLLAGGNRLPPHRASQGVVRQAFDVRGPPRGRRRLEGLDHTRVPEAPPLPPQTAVGHRVRQGMVAGVFRRGEQTRLGQNLCRLHVRQAAGQRRLGPIRHGL